MSQVSPCTLEDQLERLKAQRSDAFAALTDASYREDRDDIRDITATIRRLDSDIIRVHSMLKKEKADALQ